jgi:hypothetical protein
LFGPRDLKNSKRSSNSQKPTNLKRTIINWTLH